MLLEGKLTPARFASWHILIDDNVVMLDEKLHYENLHTLDLLHCATI